MTRDQVIDKYFLLPDTPQSVLNELVFIDKKKQDHANIASSKDESILKGLKERERQIIKQYNKFKTDGQ